MLSSFFKKWRGQDSAEPEASLDASRAHIRAWQKVLVDEHARLGHDLNELLATYERSLNYFAAHVNDLDAVSLQQECRSLESIRAVLGNAVRRLEVSTKDDRELEEEWQEWQTLLETSGQALETTQAQRIEMVRSELVLRGKHAVTSLEVGASPDSSQKDAMLSSSTRGMDRTIFVEEQLDDLDDWHEIYRRELDASHAHWQERIEEALAVADRDPVYAAAILARVRTWHGHKKQFRT
jgi:hypothetical protein